MCGRDGTLDRADYYARLAAIEALRRAFPPGAARDLEEAIAAMWRALARRRGETAERQTGN